MATEIFYKAYYVTDDEFNGLFGEEQLREFAISRIVDCDFIPADEDANGEDDKRAIKILKEYEATETIANLDDVKFIIEYHNYEIE